MELRAHEGVGLAAWNEKKWKANEDLRVPYPAILASGRPGGTGFIQVFGGNTGRYHVKSGGRLIVRDTWYESNWAPFFSTVEGTGELVIDCCLDAVYTHQKLKGIGPAYRLRNFQGRLLLIAQGGFYTKDNLPIKLEGNQRGEVILLGVTTEDQGVWPDGSTLDSLELIKAMVINQKQPVAGKKINWSQLQKALTWPRQSPPLDWNAPLPRNASRIVLQGVGTKGTQTGLRLVGDSTENRVKQE